MKPLPLLLLSALVSISSVRAQDQAPAATTAHVIGEIPDGTPPPPEPLKPGLFIPKRDIISTETHIQDGRKITVREIKPLDLPTPPATPPVSDPAIQAHLAVMRENAPRRVMLSVGATVYRAENAPSRTFGTYRPNGGEAPVTFWSSADFSLLPGIPAYVGADGIARSLMLGWSARPIESSPQQIPEFPAGPATFIVTSENPSPEALASIQSLHDVYNNEYARLKTAYESREQARLQQAAELKAHPPKPKDITLNFWRADTTNTPATTERAGQ